MLGEPRIPSSYNRRGVAREETESNCNEKPLLLTQKSGSYPVVPGESKKGFRHGGNLVRFIFQQVSVRPVWNGPECFQTTLAYTACSLLCPHCASQSYTRDYLGQFFFCKMVIFFYQQDSLSLGLCPSILILLRL